MESRTQNSFRNIFNGMLCKTVMLVFPFVIRNVMVRQLGANYVGLNTLFNSLLSFLSLTELGFGSTIVYMMYKPAAEHNTVELSALLNLFKKIYRAVGSIILVGGILVTPFLKHFISGEIPSGVNMYYVYYIYLINTSISYFMFGYRSSLFTAFQRTDIQSKIMMYCYILTSGLQVVILLLFNNYYLYLIVNPLYTILQNVMIYKRSIRFFPDITCHGEVCFETKRTLLKKTAALAGHKIGGTIIGSLDNIIISAILGLEILGKYSNYYMIISALMSFIGVYMNAILPSIGNYFVNKNNGEQYSLFLNLSFIHNWIVGWCSVCLTLFFQPFIIIWVGKDMLFSNDEMLWMAVYFYFWQFRILACNFKDAGGMWTEDIAKPFIASIADVVLNIILINMWGIRGALISTIICMLFVFFPFETHVLFKKLFKRSSLAYIFSQLVWTLEWGGIIVLMIIISKIVKQFGLNYCLCMIPLGIFIPNILFYIFNMKKEECFQTILLVKKIHRMIGVKIGK